MSNSHRWILIQDKYAKKAFDDRNISESPASSGFWPGLFLHAVEPQRKRSEFGSNPLSHSTFPPPPIREFPAGCIILKWSMLCGGCQLIFPDYVSTIHSNLFFESDRSLPIGMTIGLHLKKYYFGN